MYKSPSIYIFFIFHLHMRIIRKIRKIYNFVKLFLIKSMENYLTNTKKIILISTINNPNKKLLFDHLTIISYNSCNSSRSSFEYFFFFFCYRKSDWKDKRSGAFPQNNSFHSLLHGLRVDSPVPPELFVWK